MTNIVNNICMLRNLAILCEFSEAVRDFWALSCGFLSVSSIRDDKIVRNRGGSECHSEIYLR
jgi:hypothetical protein